MSQPVDRTDVAPPVQAALDALATCGDVSTACASSMIDLGGMAGAVRSALDCADLCAAAGRLVSRHAGVEDEVVAGAVRAAIAACRASASACGAHADHHPHCAAHARSATACAQALEALAG